MTMVSLLARERFTPAFIEATDAFNPSAPAMPFRTMSAF